METVKCEICGMTHGDGYEKDARKLVDALETDDGKLSMTLEGGALNKLGVVILLHHALVTAEEDDLNDG